MKRLLIEADGRLKTGRVSLLLFAGLLLAAGLAMKLVRPVDQALVQVRHVFAAAPVETADEVPSEPAQPQSVEPASRVETPPVEALASQIAGAPVADPVDASRVPEQAERAAVTSAETPAASPVEATPVAAASHPAEPAPVVPTAMPLRDAEPADSEAPAIPSEQLSPARPVAVATDAEPAAEISFRDLQAAFSPDQDQPQIKELTVTRAEYRELFKSWRSGGGQDQESTRPGLLVENLRSVYPLFQMKPVAIVNGVTYDLEDSSRLAAGALERYAGTVFEVAQPWNDWRAELQRLGLRPGAPVQVRYYMHGYVDNGIYGRCRLAVAWCRAQGRVAQDVEIGEVEVRGRAFAVRQQGGGAFGVFIPQQLRLQDGALLAIDPTALGSAPDVALLRQAGLI